MKEIPITQLHPLSIGQTEDSRSGTGCTVLLCPDGMPAGVDVRGGGPASRETELLNPLTNAERIHALVLSGGSAFGLAASDGVMSLLEERGFGYDVGIARVPLVVQACLFDLAVGDAHIRPDAAMGREAARLALDAPNYRDGNYGAGCGATVGKLFQMKRAMKTGIGSFALQTGELKVGAIAAVNALGDVFDWRTHRQVAGLLSPDRLHLASSEESMCGKTEVVRNRFTGNTTLCAVITNAAFGKTHLCKIAGMAHDGMARSISPVHTSADGDTIFALSVGSVQADRDLVGVLAAQAVSEAILRSVFSASSAFGHPCARDLGLFPDSGAIQIP